MRVAVIHIIAEAAESFSRNLSRVPLCQQLAPGILVHQSGHGPLVNFSEQPLPTNEVLALLQNKQGENRRLGQPFPFALLEPVPVGILIPTLYIGRQLTRVA